MDHLQQHIFDFLTENYAKNIKNLRFGLPLYNLYHILVDKIVRKFIEICLNYGINQINN